MIPITLAIIMSGTAIALVAMFLSLYHSQDRCTNGGKQHRFQPRYTETDARTQHVLKSSGGYDPDEACAAVRNLNVRRVYVGDVCEWCGATAQMPSNAIPGTAPKSAPEAASTGATAQG
jgi:hypothetical protein